MIRRAIPADIHRLLEMGRAFFIESGWSARAEFDDESFAYSCGLLMDNAILLVADHNDALVGFVGAATAVAAWNRKVLTGQEIWWYCEPAHRKGTGRELMDALEGEFRARGVSLAGMSAEEGLRSEALGRLYRQRGYFPLEKLYWKVLAA